jgi:hypothetical protein
MSNQNLSMPERSENFLRIRRVWLILGAVLVWFAVIAQFYLLIINRKTPIPEAIIRFFSYFTILTNILVALSFTAPLISPRSRAGNFFMRPATLTAITVYISVVGIIYNVVLRALWQPEGLQLLVDELLHTIIPIFFILYWLFFVHKSDIRWKSVWSWLLYPALYCIYALVRGSFSGFYPYPFINVDVLGYGKVFINIVFIVILFLLLSFVLVYLVKANAKRLDRISDE